jgi:hypothetical protein
MSSQISLTRHSFARGLLVSAPASARQQARAGRIPEGVDVRQKNQGDWRSMIYMEQKEKGKVDVAYEALVFRRSADQKFIILFTKPKASQGQGYLRIDKNLWFYDPVGGQVGTAHRARAHRRHQLAPLGLRRIALGGRIRSRGQRRGQAGRLQRADHDLEGQAGHRSRLPGHQVVGRQGIQERAQAPGVRLSGRLLRTSYYPKWKKAYSESRKMEVWYPEEMRFYDEVEKANSTLILVKSVDMKPLEANLFTKAWLESKSR